MASNFEFYSPTRVIFGKGTEQRVGALVREYGGTRVLIVYGGKSAVRSGVLDRAEKSLAEAGISSWTLGGVVPNPHLDKVYEGIRIGKENSIDFLLAVGGGQRNVQQQRHHSGGHPPEAGLQRRHQPPEVRPHGP